MTPGSTVRLGALIAAVVTICGCGVAVRQTDRGLRAVANASVFREGRRGALTARERAWALTAWRYFEGNVQPGSGLVSAADKSPAVTMWQIGDYLAALTAARELKLVTPQQFDERFRRVLHVLNVMGLYADHLPNRWYNPSTVQMVDGAGKPGATGWSAIDLGRLLIWLRITRDRYPVYAEYIDRAVLRWNFCDAVDRRGALRGGARRDQQTETYQEGRLGYEQYAALGYRAWGFETAQASSLDAADTAVVLGIPLLVDRRDPRVTGVQTAVVSLPYVLLGIEFGWRDGADDVARRWASLSEAVYRVQERRYERDRILTARTDHPLSQAPYFVHDSVFAGGYAFNTIDDAGNERPAQALVSTRAVFGLWTLWNTGYTARLMDAIEPLQRADRGWFEGRYETTGGAEELITAGTNAVVLEALLRKVDGPLFVRRPVPGYFDRVLAREFERPDHCLPDKGPGAEGAP